MSRKKCKRKVWALVNPITHATEGASYTPESLLDKLRIRELSAIEAFRSGRAGLQEWSDVTAMLNLAETMAKGGVGPEALQSCTTMQEELIAAAKRFERTGKMGVSGIGLATMRDLYEFHDLQRQSITRGEYDRWIKKTSDTMRSKAPGVVDVADLPEGQP